MPKRIYVDQLMRGKTMLGINKAVELYLKGEAELVFYTVEFSESDIRKRIESAFGKRTQ